MTIDWEKEGYVCEQHPDKVFEHDNCPGPGMKNGKRTCGACGQPVIIGTSFCEGELNGACG